MNQAKEPLLAVAASLAALSKAIESMAYVFDPDGTWDMGNPPGVVLDDQDAIGRVPPEPELGAEPVPVPVPVPPEPELGAELGAEPVPVPVPVPEPEPEMTKLEMSRLLVAVAKKYTSPVLAQALRESFEPGQRTIDDVPPAGRHAFVNRVINQIRGAFE